MIKDYIIKENLGLGAYGTIYKVLKKSNNNLYVIKRISLVGMTQEQIEKAKLESKILSSINSPYIVKYYESFEENDFLNIVMEYCDGGDLNEFIIKNEQTHTLLKESVIWNIFLKILIGLSHLHKLKILHRDLKPLNIFLIKNNNLDIKIGDFGIAKILKENNFANTLIGTPYYISPELCEDLPYNEKSDIWALGCILYELCTYKHPFNAKYQASLVMKILENKPKSIHKYYSDELHKLINLILDKNYKTRPSCDDILRLPFVVDKLKNIGLYDKIEYPPKKNYSNKAFSSDICYNNRKRIEKNIQKMNINTNKSFDNIKENKIKKLYNNRQVLHISKSTDNIKKSSEEENKKNDLILKKEPKNTLRNKEFKTNFLNNIKNTIDAYELKLKNENKKNLNIKKYYPKYKKPNLNLLDIDNDVEIFQNIKTTDILNNEKVDNLIENKLLKMKKDKKEMNIKDFAAFLNSDINKIKSVNKHNNFNNNKYENKYKMNRDKNFDKKIINNNNNSVDINSKRESELLQKNITKSIYLNNNLTNIEEKKNSMIINKINNMYQKLKNINIKNNDNNNHEEQK